MLDMEIRSHLWKYILNSASLNDFKDWFVPATWDAESAINDGGTLSLIHEIQLRLAEFSNDHWQEDELKKKLAFSLIMHSDVPMSASATNSVPMMVNGTVNDESLEKLVPSGGGAASAAEDSFGHLVSTGQDLELYEVTA